MTEQFIGPWIAYLYNTSLWQQSSFILLFRQTFCCVKQVLKLYSTLVVSTLELGGLGYLHPDMRLSFRPNRCFSMLQASESMVWFTLMTFYSKLASDYRYWNRCSIMMSAFVYTKHYHLMFVIVFSIKNTPWVNFNLLLFSAHNKSIDTEI